MSAEADSAIADLQMEAQALVKSLHESIEAQPHPDLIYHYTNAEGLKGILQSGEFWLTDIFSMNDPSELHFGVDGGLSQLETISDVFLIKAVSKNIANSVRSHLRRTFNYFAMCFSTTAIDIGQWRAYADDGKGFVLEFETKPFLDAFVKNGMGSPRSSFAITYGKSGIEEIHAKLISLAKKAIEQCGPDPIAKLGTDRLAELFQTIITNMIMSSISVKHEAYASEKEYRFLEVISDTPEVGISVRGDLLSRYRKFNWRQSAAASLKRIIVGPTDPARGQVLAHNCLHASKLLSVEIGVSSIPYRPSK